MCITQLINIKDFYHLKLSHLHMKRLIVTVNV